MINTNTLVISDNQRVKVGLSNHTLAMVISLLVSAVGRSKVKNSQFLPDLCCTFPPLCISDNRLYLGQFKKVVSPSQSDPNVRTEPGYK